MGKSEQTNDQLLLGDDEERPEWQRTWHSLWELLGCKWTFHIIRLLSMSDHGFNEMERRIVGITSTMLSRRLKQLEAEGIISRTIEPTSPPTSCYQLTETGHELAVHLRDIERLNPTDINE